MTACPAAIMFYFFSTTENLYIWIKSRLLWLIVGLDVKGYKRCFMLRLKGSEQNAFLTAAAAAATSDSILLMCH